VGRLLILKATLARSAERNLDEQDSGIAKLSLGIQSMHLGQKGIGHIRNGYTFGYTDGGCLWICLIMFGLSHANQGSWCRFL
jgi:hypothetical protein